jgi:hypothetical protein
MSLKAFHIAFICLSIILALGFGIWELSGYTTSGEGEQLAFGLLSLAGGAGLIVYGIRFLRKLKNVSYL